ncbi:MAG: hemolysin family protein [Bacteroidia bacterium]|nr:hemolysin family protein [Bacteroidia bacterium]MCX7651424.1 hemolysin family protein [Bacteroidia bacterium]MDW8417059.1 hemolysin family protein [Bacteroidia bacterium]
MDPVPLAVQLSAFLIASGLFSGYETAFFSLTTAEILSLQRQLSRHPWTYWLRYFSENPQILLSTLLIGNTLVNLSFTLFLLNVAHPYGPLAEALASFLALAMIVLFGEILPKTLAIGFPRFFLRVGTPVIQLAFWLIYPLSQGLDKLRAWIEAQWQPLTSPERLSQLVESLPNEVSPPVEKKVLKNILLLRQLPVKSFMLSRMDMRSVSAELSWPELKKTFSEIPYIRIPVYRGSRDEVIGILLLKDLLPHWDKEEFSNWHDLIRPAYFVPETKNAYELLMELKNLHQQVAIVVDEFGSVAGIISLQRLLEVVFGYGEEEVRTIGALYETNSDGSVCFKAQVPLVVVQELLGLPADFFTQEEARTAENLAEFLLSLAEKIPQKGEVLTYQNYAFEVVEGSAHRIDKVRAYRVSESHDNHTDS